MLKPTLPTYWNLIDQSPVGIFYTDKAGDWSYVNKRWCEITGLSPEEANNKAWQYAIHPQDRERCQEEWLHCIKKNLAYESEYRYLHKDGKIIWVLTKAFPEHNMKNEGSGYIGIVEDITEHKESEAKLEKSEAFLKTSVKKKSQELFKINKNLQKEIAKHKQLQKELTRFYQLQSMFELASGLAHELNQPLAAINNYAKGCTRRMQNNNIDENELQTALHKISDQAERAGDIILRMRSLVRKAKLNLSFEYINSVVKEAIEIMVFDAFNIKPEISFDLSAENPIVCIDKIQIQQVIINLIKNSVESVKIEQPKLLIKTEMLKDTSVLVSIQDNGDGINSDNMKRIFEPFFSTKQEGMGIGLSICHSIIDAHGGQLKVENSPNTGAKFYFNLGRETEKITG